MRFAKPKPFARRPKPRLVSRSFRIPLAIDKALGIEARKRGWTKTFLIKEFVIAGIKYHQADKGKLPEELA